mgnify:CR=1 FL=1
MKIVLVIYKATGKAKKKAEIFKQRSKLSEFNKIVPSMRIKKSDNSLIRLRSLPLMDNKTKLNRSKTIAVLDASKMKHPKVKNSIIFLLYCKVITKELKFLMLKQLFSSCLLLYISVLYLRQRIFCAIYCYNIILKLNSEVIFCNPYAKCNLGVSDVCSRFISLHIIFPYYAFGKKQKRKSGSNLFVFLSLLRYVYRLSCY